MEAMLQMGKIDVEGLQRAYESAGAETTVGSAARA
jgi:hypothetical protein